MKTLLNSKRDPVSRSWGFWKAPFANATKALREWQEPWGRKVEYFRCDLDMALARLNPLGFRTLIISTSSPWTAVFLADESGPQAAVPYLVETCGWEGLQVTCIDETYDRHTNRGHYGSVQFQLYSPDSSDFTKTVRALAATNDGGKWRFYQDGAPLPFEKTERYASRRIRDRFTAKMLEEYCAALGIHLFESSFYGPECALFIPTKSE